MALRIRTITTQFFEAEIINGLAPFAGAELETALGRAFHPLQGGSAEAIPFTYGGNWDPLFKLTTINAIYLGLRFPIPRPKALLGHQTFHELLDQIAAIQQAHPPDSFHTFYLSAAGSESSVFRRFRTNLTDATGLADDEDEGDLLIRVRPSPGKPSGWEVLLRLTPRPLSARSWRVADMPGALNGPTAAAMVQLSHPSPEQRVLNLMCGSGTLLVERLLAGPAALAAGSDHSMDTLALAMTNLAAANVHASLLCQDDRAAAFLDAAFDVLLADLPWGQLLGEQEDIEGLLPALLQEAARLARPQARFVLVTHTVQLMYSLLDQQRHLWHTEQVVKLARGNIHPAIFCLRRSVQ